MLLDGSTNATGGSDEQEHAYWQEEESFGESAVGCPCCYEYAKQYAAPEHESISTVGHFRSSNPPPKYPAQYCDQQFSLPWIVRAV